MLDSVGGSTTLKAVQTGVVAGFFACLAYPVAASP